MGGPGSGQKRGGRPTKLTSELHKQIVRLIETGNYTETAAAVAGINPSTLREWLRRGARERSGRFRRFSAAVKRAEATAEAGALVRIRQAGKANWTAEAWYLERKFPTRWGRWERPSSEPSDETRKAREIVKQKTVRDLLDRVSRELGVDGNPSEPGD